MQLFMYLEYQRNRNGAVKDDRKITSQMTGLLQINKAIIE